MSDGVSQLVKMLNYKFVLTEEHTESYIFYKDEGKKDKCIELTVQLFDEFDCLVCTRIVPLKVTLLYSNGTPCVTGNEILSLSPDTRLTIDTTGFTVIKARINAVSKGHQSQLFKIQVEEDTGDPNKLSYITPVCSVPVEVRSKRNNLKRKLNDLTQFVTMPGDDPNANKLPHTNSEGLPNYPPSNPAGYYYKPIAPVYPKPAVATAQPVLRPLQPITANAPFTVPPNLTLDAAVENVLRWAGTVMNGIQEIQWKLIGYERFPDGSLDTSRPLFSMTNPSQVIHDIVQQYSTDTMASLHVLVREADVYREQAFKDAMSMVPIDTETEVATSLVNLTSPRVSQEAPAPERATIPASNGQARTKLDFAKTTVMQEPGTFVETFDWSNSNSEMLLGITVNSDRNVFYIVGALFTTTQGIIGLPAYDNQKQLVGFYRESTNCNRNIALKFRSVNAHRGITLAEEYVLAAKRDLEELLQQKSSKVFSLTSCQDDLERMKQDALIYSWMHDNNGGTSMAANASSLSDPAPAVDAVLDSLR